MQRDGKRSAFYCTALTCLLAALQFSGCYKKINTKSVSVAVTVRVSLGANGQQGNGPVGNPAAPSAIDRAAISDDGRYVAFTSSANNLVANDNNSASDVFLWDNLMRTCTLVSINTAGTASANAASFSPSISGDGRYVVFVSTATDLDPVKFSSSLDVFVRDMKLGSTSLVSRATGPVGVASNGNSSSPQISKDGRYVVFHSNATNLDPADSDVLNDIYRRDLIAFDTLLISRASGAAGAKGTGGGGNGSLNPSISRDGHIVVYQSDAAGLITGGNGEGGPVGNTLSHIYMRNVSVNTTIRVTAVPGPGGIGILDPDGLSENPTISGDGNFITFRSFASNLVPKNDNNPDIFWRDVRTVSSSPGFEVMSVHTSGVRAGSGCNFPVISETGQMVVFESPSTSLVDNDSNGVRDIFVHDRTSGVTSRVSVSTYGGEMNAQSLKPMISGNGAYVVFYTEATNAGDLDTNGASDFYMRGPPF
jgi:Tol biopolymer transport system component